MQTFFEQLYRNLSFKNGDLVNIDGEIVASGKELGDSKKVIRKLTEFIYSTFYTGMHSGTRKGQRTVIAIETDDDFISKLSAIHPEKKQISKNWIIKEVIDENVLKIIRNEITLTIKRNVHQLENEQLKIPEIGTTTSILLSCHYPNISPGFYAFKSEQGELNPDLGILRLYFNLQFVHAVDFTQGLLDILYSRKILFDYKIFKTLRRMPRPDCAVLYFSSKDFEAIEKTILPYLYLHSYMFNDNVSPFHYPLLKGVGLAEEPDVKEAHESYGLNRCRLIAEVICSSLNELKETGRLPFEYFTKHFQKNNVDIQRVYLNSGSSLGKKLISITNN